MAEKNHQQEIQSIIDSYKHEVENFTINETPILDYMSSRGYISRLEIDAIGITLFFNKKTQALDFRERDVNQRKLPETFLFAQSTWQSDFVKLLRERYTNRKNIDAVAFQFALNNSNSMKSNRDLELFYRLYYKEVGLKEKYQIDLQNENRRYNAELQSDRARAAAVIGAFQKMNQNLSNQYRAPASVLPNAHHKQQKHSPRQTKKSFISECGWKPFPKMGCKIGRCVNGRWEQLCDQNAVMTCGIKPVPEIGCEVTECVNGVWEQQCKTPAIMSCGPKPFAKLGCKIGRCFNGRWEQVCH